MVPLCLCFECVDARISYGEEATSTNYEEERREHKGETQSKGRIQCIQTGLMYNFVTSLLFVSFSLVFVVSLLPTNAPTKWDSEKKRKGKKGEEKGSKK